MKKFLLIFLPLGLSLLLSCKTKFFGDDHILDTNTKDTKDEEIDRAKSHNCYKDGKIWEKESDECVQAQKYCMNRKDGSIWQNGLCLSLEDQCLLEKGAKWTSQGCRSAKLVCEVDSRGVLLDGNCLTNKEYCNYQGVHYHWAEDNTCKLKGFLELCQQKGLDHKLDRTINILAGYVKNELSLIGRPSCLQMQGHLKSETSIKIIYDERNPGFGQIEDAYPLRDFTQLKHLELTNNKITDITPLTSLKNLNYLDLQNNSLKDLSPLAQLTNLKELHLGYNRDIVTITPLKDLKNIQKLYLFGAKITQLEPLEKLTHLTYLSLRDNPVSNIYPLRFLKQLNVLDLKYTPISRTALIDRDEKICPIQGDISQAIKDFCRTPPR